MAPKPTWDIEKIKSGFERFLKEHEHLPTSEELDSVQYLPAARTIERRYGGLEKLRTDLGYPVTHFGKGESRSQISKTVGRRGIDAENAVKEILIEKFGKYFVHEEKRVYPEAKVRMDFFVYTPSGDFAIDVFYPKNAYTMMRELNIKEQTYKDYAEKLFLVVANPSITQEEIDILLENKRNILKENFVLCSLQTLSEKIEKMNRFQAGRG